MVKVKLQNVFFEPELNSYLDQNKMELGLKTRSQMLRRIIKERYRICKEDGCIGFSVVNGYCFKHNKREGNGHGTETV
ncbi:hypothetical protein A2903_01505 [Candidatus Nomurabacteria bacterium RIFCSPLOWO2_01_FULL_33_17]|uniref:Uncharacterized protein n=1 Tax=Candidatus Nomurabacteria bacterium RIFCSPLOWO2_01_FULL_33_17 TaxID=1801764 RepID=A0A1F6WPR0_9BACT|nr:MAG: hypothetical protein A2903_01505 [Candidatus Nomurabacteria bacterium RIFCSPLOWO2_01_FULL_33_17]